MFADCGTFDPPLTVLHASAERIHTLPWISDIRADATPVHNELDFRLWCNRMQNILSAAKLLRVLSRQQKVRL